MKTCTTNLRRHGHRVTASIIMVGAALLGLVPSATADAISDKRAQAAALLAQIQSLGLKESGLSEQFDGDILALNAAKARVAKAAADAAHADLVAGHDKAVLRQVAVQAYMGAGGAAVVATSGSATAGSAQSGLIKAEYESDLADNQSDAINQYQAASQQAEDAKTALTSAQSSVQVTVNQVADDKEATIAAADQLRATYSQVQGQIAQLVYQLEQEQLAEQRREEAARLAAAEAAQAAERAAMAAAAAAAAAAQRAQIESSSSSSALVSSAPSLAPPPPVASGAAGAVQAALSRVGDPYVWGASGPSYFDCSGLVMWAYDQAGISLPHFSGAQYADTTHISLNDLEPGDLVFPRDPGEHVAMYIGNGEIVEAPQTGEDVHVVPLDTSFFVYASRV
jgi:cell wall-associated NlpC family hydrolase